MPDWLNQNSVVVTAVATAAGVAVALGYSIFAGLQWRATKRQADITQALFETGHRPWLAITCNHEQACLGRGDYPASTKFVEIGQHQFGVAMENKGSVPAIVTKWRIVVERDGDEPRVRESPTATETVIYPAVGESLARIEFEDRWERVKGLRGDTFVCGGGEKYKAEANRTIRLTAAVTYRGVAEKVYSTAAVYEVGPETSFELTCRDVRLD